ncbi:hypothetical protein C0J52_12034 [Blattella germanica]|nr:hypothetical protein C0J52_12034 [Blattella germanica]
MSTSRCKRQLVQKANTRGILKVVSNPLLKFKFQQCNKKDCRIVIYRLYITTFFYLVTTRNVSKMADIIVSFRQCAVIEFLVKEEQSAVDIHQRLQRAYGDTCMGASSVRRWVKHFKDGNTSINDQPTKCQSMEWHHLDSTSKKKTKTVQSVGKVMGSVFWDAQGCLLVEFLELGQTINAARYIQTLVKLCRGLRDKRPGRNVISQHDNVRPHTARATVEKIRTFGWEILPHPPYSPDLALSSFQFYEGAA